MGSPAKRICSPCPTCDHWGEDKDECAPICQARVNYLSEAFGEPWYDVKQRAITAKATLRVIIAETPRFEAPRKKTNFQDPASHNLREPFPCSICGKEVLTSHTFQKTCAEPACHKEHNRRQDKVRREKNRVAIAARCKERYQEKKAKSMEA